MIHSLKKLAFALNKLSIESINIKNLIIYAQEEPNISDEELKLILARSRNLSEIIPIFDQLNDNQISIVEARLKALLKQNGPAYFIQPENSAFLKAFPEYRIILKYKLGDLLDKYPKQLYQLGINDFWIIEYLNECDILRKNRIITSLHEDSLYNIQRFFPNLINYIQNYALERNYTLYERWKSTFDILNKGEVYDEEDNAEQQLKTDPVYFLTRTNLAPKYPKLEQRAIERITKNSSPDNIGLSLYFNENYYQKYPMYKELAIRSFIKSGLDITFLNDSFLDSETGQELLNKYIELILDTEDYMRFFKVYLHTRFKDLGLKILEKLLNSINSTNYQNILSFLENSTILIKYSENAKIQNLYESKKKEFGYVHNYDDTSNDYNDQPEDIWKSYEDEPEEYFSRGQ